VILRFASSVDKSRNGKKGLAVLTNGRLTECSKGDRHSARDSIIERKYTVDGCILGLAVTVFVYNFNVQSITLPNLHASFYSFLAVNHQTPFILTFPSLDLPEQTPICKFTIQAQI
jgi:hypothetical protein